MTSAPVRDPLADHLLTPGKLSVPDGALTSPAPARSRPSSWPRSPARPVQQPG